MAQEEMSYLEVGEDRGGVEKVESGAHRSRRRVHQLKFWGVQTDGDTYNTSASSASHYHGPWTAKGETGSKLNCQTDELWSIKAEIAATAQVVCKP